MKSKADFDAKISGSGGLVVVDFFATWCGPCVAIAPKFIEMSDKYTDVVFIKVDVDELEDVAAACEISAMPTFQFYRDGKKVDALVGANEADLKAKIESNK